MSHLSRPPRGQQRDKPYREALRMELAAAGDNMKKTALHIARCEAGDMQAIKDLADRLDGRPAQNPRAQRPRQRADRPDRPRDSSRQCVA